MSTATMLAPAATAPARSSLPAAALGAVPELRGALRRRRYATREVLALQGTDDPSLYLVESGVVTLSLASPEGDELLLGRLGPAEVFGALPLLDGGPWPVTAVAVSPC